MNPPDTTGVEAPDATGGEVLDGLVDLAAKRLGGMVLHANDEFFAPKENLLEPRDPVFDPDRFTDRGKEMDGWETRRRRVPGNDWCLVRLGVPGIVRRLVIDTTHFTGNFPEAASVEGCALEGDPGAAVLQAEEVEWVQLLPRTDLAGDRRNVFAVDVPIRVTHVRLQIHPDGGVARLRVHGEALPDLRVLAGPGGALDLAALVNGGSAVACSNAHYSSPANLLTVGDARDMSDGWETRRRRGPGHDWVVLRLATTGVVERVEVDTTHFKGNHPDRCVVESSDEPDADVPGAEAAWRTLIPSTPLGPHARHRFDVGEAAAPATHVRLQIHPDGGVARLRLHGRVTDEGWERAGVRLLDALPQSRARAELASCCASSAWVTAMVSGRPHADMPTLLAAADAAWAALGPEDWLEAFAAHPRIGDRAGGAWSKQEQAGTAAAGDDVLARLAAGNRAYEERFGHVFLICATGRSAEDMLAELERRLANDPDTELATAAEEQRKIMRIRLAKLMRPEP